MNKVVHRLLLLALAFGAASCSSVDSTPAEQPFPVAAESDLSFRSEEKLESHWLKHRAEFEPGLTKDQYLAKARAFFRDNSPDKEIKYEGGGDVLHYKASTNEFGVLSSEPVIRTYFLPTDGQRYWQRK